MRNMRNTKLKILRNALNRSLMRWYCLPESRSMLSLQARSSHQRELHSGGWLELTSSPTVKRKSNTASLSSFRFSRRACAALQLCSCSCNTRHQFRGSDISTYQTLLDDSCPVNCALCSYIDIPFFLACPAKTSLKDTRAPKGFVSETLLSDSPHTPRSSIELSDQTLMTSCMIQLHLFPYLTMP